MTEAGSILGTAQYLAPEQAKGLPVDQRSDLYSVGVVLYEMLTGQVPFHGDSAVTVALKHVNELPPEPAELVPDLPYALNQIVLKALAKDPDRRYQDADRVRHRPQERPQRRAAARGGVRSFAERYPAGGAARACWRGGDARHGRPAADRRAGAAGAPQAPRLAVGAARPLPRCRGVRRRQLLWAPSAATAR